MRSKIITRAVATPLLVIGVLGIDGGSVASAQPVVQADANGNNVIESQTTPDRGQGVGGEQWRNTLVPPAVGAIGPGASRFELATLAAGFPPPVGGNAGWMIANGPPLPGTFTVVHYDAFEDSNPAPEAPADGDVWPDCDIRTAAGTKDCVTIRYNNPVGGVETNPVAPNVLRWVQFVCTNSPRAGRGTCLPLANAYIDLPDPPDAGGRPFYYTEAEHALFSGAGGVPPLTFYDKPLRPFPLNRVDVEWGGRLYLVEWNGITPNPAAPGPNGTLTIRGGVEWGWLLTCVNINIIPVGTYLRGGGDRDRPDTEFDGAEPTGMAPPACQVSYIPSKYKLVLWVLLLVLVGAALVWLYARRRARTGHSG